MTLREALKSANLKKVFSLINKKDSRNIAACDRPSMEQTVSSYTKVVDELLSKPRARKYSMSWVVKESIDPFDKKKYADVCFKNPKYVAPAKGLKPWGGKPPEGYYNCNLNKHNEYFAAGMTAWSKLIDTPILNEANYSLERVVAEILWEMTFYGWTEKKVEQRTEEIGDLIKKSKKDVEEGKYIEIPPKKEGGMKIVIPKTVSKQIDDICKKYENKRGN